MRTVLALLLLSMTALAAHADVIIEERSGAEFPAAIALSMEGGEQQLRAAGTGLRTKWRIKVYAACFYVERSVDLGEQPYEQAIGGDFAKRIVMRFLRDVDGEKIGGAFRDGIRKTIEEGKDEPVDAFCGFFTEKVRKGEEIVLTYLPGKGLAASQAGVELGEISDGAVIAAVWATWFGEDPVGKDLKRGLVGL